MYYIIINVSKRLDRIIQSVVCYGWELFVFVPKYFFRVGVRRTLSIFFPLSFGGVDKDFESQ